MAPRKSCVFDEAESVCIEVMVQQLKGNRSPHAFEALLGAAPESAKDLYNHTPALGDWPRGKNSPTRMHFGMQQKACQIEPSHPPETSQHTARALPELDATSNVSTVQQIGRFPFSQKYLQAMAQGSPCSVGYTIPSIALRDISSSPFGRSHLGTSSVFRTEASHRAEHQWSRHGPHQYSHV